MSCLGYATMTFLNVDSKYNSPNYFRDDAITMELQSLGDWNASIGKSGFIL